MSYQPHKPLPPGKNEGSQGKARQKGGGKSVTPAIDEYEGQCSTSCSMPTRAENLAALDRFMAEPKRIVSPRLQGEWAPTHIGDERILKWPLEIEGETVPGAYFAMTANPRRRDMVFLRIHIFCPAAICRLDHTDETHANSIQGQADGLLGLVHGPHFHAWTLNRRYFRDFERPTNLLDAAPFASQGRSFDSILRWFCDETNIEQLPADHRVELPAFGKLL